MNGSDDADTNWPVANYKQGGEASDGVTKAVILVGMRMAELDYVLPTEAVEATDEEWVQMRNDLLRVMTENPSMSTLRLCVGLLKWLGEQIKPECRHLAWDESIHEEWCDACDKCVAAGSQKHHWAANPHEDVSMMLRCKQVTKGKSKAVKGLKHGAKEAAEAVQMIAWPKGFGFQQRSLYALFWALQDWTQSVMKPNHRLSNYNPEPSRDIPSVLLLPSLTLALAVSP